MSLTLKAQAVLKGKIRQTPIEFSGELSKVIQASAYLKLESLQITGSFKLRGALFYLSQLDDISRGVACCSAGNHGLAVAYAAKMENAPCTVYVPKSVDQAKYEKMLKLNAHVIVAEFPGYDETLIWAEKEAEKKGMPFISAFDHPAIIAANGETLAAEIEEVLPEAVNYILPIGGGGMAAGFASHLKGKRIICCQHESSPSFYLSLKQGQAITKMPPIETVAGGIEGGIGKQAFDILKEHVNEVCLLSEDEIFEGFRWMLKHHQILIEPSSAVVIAAALFGKLPPLKDTTVFVITGRNVSYETINKIVSST